MRPRADDEHDEGDGTSLIYGQWRLPRPVRVLQVVTAAAASLGVASLPATAIAAALRRRAACCSMMSSGLLRATREIAELRPLSDQVNACIDTARKVRDHR